MGKQHDLAKKGRAEFVNMKDKSGCTPLMHAAKAGKIDTVRFLIQCGARLDCIDRQGDSAVRMAHLNDHDDVLEILLALTSPTVELVSVT
mmetsp:Transcript_6365/g.18893  ORF Transcript_6365/g.18893 Transcript_6365/m.18893 type:complete len:90 (+) Transcript_6365:310-579(+)